MSGALTYDEAIELAAKLYTGQRLAEMALAGDLGMTRVTGADREPMAALAAELRGDALAVQELTRQGREAWPAGLRPGEVPGQRKASARARLHERYAIKFAIECDGEPDDVSLSAVLGRCARTPRPEEYPAIRAAVGAYRAGLIEGTKPYEARGARLPAGLVATPQGAGLLGW